VPIAHIAVTQKRLIAQAGEAGKPVITATQMLESMVSSRLPTRAEATDVANAILDGTDALMLSEESAMGRYPVEAVAMLADIAAATEPSRNRSGASGPPGAGAGPAPTAAAAMATMVEHALATVPCAVVLVPTRTGRTARLISRFKPAVWVVALSRDAVVCQRLMFSYGVHPVQLADDDEENWRSIATQWVGEETGGGGGIALLTAGPSARHPDANYRIELLRVGGTP
jgi:pyruvate kinase